MIATALATLGKIGTSIYGAYKSAQLGRQAKQAEDQAHTGIMSNLTARANEDYVNRSEIQGVLTKVREQLGDRFKQARARGIVGGLTDESIAMQQMADNQLIADATSSLASNASTYKDKVLDSINNESQRYGQVSADRFDAQAKEVRDATKEANKMMDGIAKSFA